MKLLVIVLVIFAHGCIISRSQAANLFRFATDTGVILQEWEVRKSPGENWAKFEITDAAYHRGYNEFQTRIFLEGQLDEFKYLVIRCYGPLSAYKLYWDDELICANGLPSEEPDKEEPGQLLQTVKLPRRMVTEGSHTMQLIHSNWTNLPVHSFLNNDFGLGLTFIGYGDVFLSTERSAILSATLGGMVLILTALYSLVLFYSGKPYKSYLLLSIFCFLNIGVLVIHFSELYFPVNMAYYTAVSTLLLVIVALKSAFLCYFFAFYFRFDWRKRSFPLLLIFSGLGLVYAGFLFNFFTMTGIGIVMATYASYHRQVGSQSALIGLLGMVLLALLTNHLPFTPGYAHGSTFFAFAMIFSVGRQIKNTNRVKHQLELRSARLETAMIKKSIQPHFLMNTLLSIISWLETQPKVAVELIQSLAQEFRMINDISGKSEVTLREELDLCKNHLQLMSLRKSAEYKLIVKNVPLDYKIPPMIFHTLMENGLTHAFRGGEAGTFWVTYQARDDFDVFTLKNDGSQIKLIGQATEGVGITFVRSQLRAKYKRRWHLEAGIKNDNWVVNLTIYKS